MVLLLFCSIAFLPKKKKDESDIESCSLPHLFVVPPMCSTPLGNRPQATARAAAAALAAVGLGPKGEAAGKSRVNSGRTRASLTGGQESILVNP